MSETLPELAVRPGWTRPDGLPQGECTISRYGDALHIDHADPRVLISAELLAEAFVHPAEGVSIGPPPGSENGTPFWTGAVLKIAAVNRTLIYRITEYVPSVRGYIAEWPD
jgi:hypothetical protein